MLRTTQGVNALGFPKQSREQCAEDAIFQVPFGQSGGHADMGKLALMLVTNEFINGESFIQWEITLPVFSLFPGEIVLIDGGTLLRHPAGY